jgi:pimeloyl-ACP methyl ester carboxylesterase
MRRFVLKFLRSPAGAMTAFIIAVLLTASCAQLIGEDIARKSAVERVAGPAGALRVDDSGTGGVPVLFVHSFAGSKSHWAAQLAELRKTRRAVALDLRGHGQSERPAGGDYAVRSLAKDIAAVADGLGLERFVLVGHSLGGAASIAYAGEHPNRVAGLVLVGAPGKTPPAQARQIMSALQADYEKVILEYCNKLLAGAQPQVDRQLRSEMAGVSRDAGLSLIRASVEFDALPALAAYRGPKLAIVMPHGESPGDLHKLVADLPYRLIIGTSHWPHMDEPAEFNRMLGEFLASAA